MKFTEEQSNSLQSAFRQYNVSAAYLFGSRVRGTAGKQSDIDIAVLFAGDKSDFKDSLKRQSELSSALQKIVNIEVDLIDLAEVKSPVLKHRAVMRGQLIFSDDSKKRQRFERHVLHEYEDTQYLRRVQSEIMRRQIKEGTFGKPLISIFSKQR